MAEPEKKIIIDEDWKTQVLAEKEAFEREQKKSDAPSTPQADTEAMLMPPASYEMLLTSLATEAMMALGQIPHPTDGTTESHPEHAKYLIDTIEVLKEKTKGNLTSAEEMATDDLLHQLRMVFVSVTSGPTQ